MRVMTESSLGRELVKGGLAKDVGLTMITRDNTPTAMLVPYEVWFQIQHFVSRVIES